MPTGYKIKDVAECGPVQDRLRVLVADKLAGARRQIAELTTLVHELDHAAATLERHRPDGPCDDECGCVTDAASEAPRPQTVSLVIKPTAIDGPVPIACTLGAGS